MSIEKVFMERLRSAIEEDNGSKKLTAQRLCITETTLNNWLTGRRKPMSESLINAAESMGLALIFAQGETDGHGEKILVAEESAPVAKEPTFRPATVTEREMQSRIDELSRQLAQKELDLMEARTTVKNLNGQVEMLYSLLSGSRKNFICTNNGDGELNQINK